MVSPRTRNLPRAEIHVVALVLHADQLGDHVALAQLVAHAQRHHHRW
jgi:hypothetical protein